MEALHRVRHALHRQEQCQPQRGGVDAGQGDSHALQGGQGAAQELAIRHDAELGRRSPAFLARGKPPKVALCAIMHARFRQMMGTLKAYYREQDALATADQLALAP